VLYGGRSPENLLYTAELERWRGRFDVQVQVAVDQAAAGWHGRVGVVTTLVPRAAFEPDHTVAMVCGPEVMMRFAVAALQERGVPSDAIHVSLERSMKCAIRLCGHCQLGPEFICHDGPVFTSDRVEPLLRVREL
jgi:NAD(P)H-flavin reductase